MSGFGGRHILVTGASTGIGLATARLLASEGAKVSLIARNQEKLAEAVATIRASGGHAVAARADVTNRPALLAAIDRAEQEFGPVDGLFANAGTGGSFASLVDYDDGGFDSVMATNVTSIFWALKRVMPGMNARRAGSIVVTGSLASERGMAGNIAYVASKHAALGLARAAAAEGAPHNVRVNCVVPGLIDTPMLMQIPGDLVEVRTGLGKSVPLGRIGSAEEAASLVAFLLSDAASHITAQSIAVDGGLLGTLSLH
jgi:NAD(P)-dependent dehydrogenase (short-subunit alcohol dehydrogenase family)